MTDLTLSAPSTFEPLAYAVDFGTSNSLVVAANKDATTAPLAIDPEAPDPTILRSILYFPEKGAASPLLFGDEALRAYADAGMQGRLLRSLKRFLPDPSFVGTMVGSRRYRLEDLIASILRAIRERANALFHKDVKRLLLGRPARYSDNEELDQLAERRMRDAAMLAGFSEIDFFAEPIAAARDFETDLSEPRTVLVADLGGGTSDFTVVRMDKRGFQSQDVLATAGLSVAGDALDGALMRKELSKHFGAYAEYTVSFGQNKLTMPAPLIDMLCTPAKLALLQTRDVQQFLKDVRAGAVTEYDRELMERFLAVAEDAQGFHVFEAVEHTKRALSNSPVGEFHFSYADIDIRDEITRQKFNAACKNQVELIFDCVEKTLEHAGIKRDQVELVCLTGGTSRVPVVVERFAEWFGADRIRRLKGLHSVVQGLGFEAQRQLVQSHCEVQG